MIWFVLCLWLLSFAVTLWIAVVTLWVNIVVLHQENLEKDFFFFADLYMIQGKRKQKTLKCMYFIEAPCIKLNAY